MQCCRGQFFPHRLSSFLFRMELSRWLYLGSSSSTILQRDSPHRWVHKLAGESPTKETYPPSTAATSQSGWSPSRGYLTIYHPYIWHLLVCHSYFGFYIFSTPLHVNLFFCYFCLCGTQSSGRSTSKRAPECCLVTVSLWSEDGSKRALAEVATRCCPVAPA